MTFAGGVGGRGGFEIIYDNISCEIMLNKEKCCCEGEKCTFVNGLEMSLLHGKRYEQQKQWTDKQQERSISHSEHTSC